MFWETLLDALIDTCLDTLKIAPFLFLIYLLMEFIENKAEDKTNRILAKAGRVGPVVGGLLGVIPQCGFSAACSTLFSGRVITLGTLIAAYLSTSDEMLPIMISAGSNPLTILKILGAKVVIGMVAGLIIDLVCHAFRKRRGDGDQQVAIHELCEREGCKCEDGILKSALHHFLHIIIYIFAFTLVLNIAVGFIGEDNISTLFVNVPVVGSLISGLVGLIPNCASSIVITNLYLNGIISSGVMMSGLLVGSGVGLLVLFRTNKPLKHNLGIAGLLYIIGVGFGILIDILKISF